MTANIFTYCDSCGELLRVEVEFPGWDGPFKTTECTCPHCGAKLRVWDNHKYDANGNVI